MDAFPAPETGAYLLFSKWMRTNIFGVDELPWRIHAHLGALAGLHFSLSSLGTYQALALEVFCEISMIDETRT